ncbi:MAG: hypothetical protein IKC17_06510 [Bacteroidales bacterium]|nr:hypothetical protein [Bacteroidales bacterium]
MSLIKQFHPAAILCYGVEFVFIPDLMDVIPDLIEVIPDLIGDLGDLWNIKIKANEVNVPLGIWLVKERWFYLVGRGWNGGWWCFAFRRVAAILPLPSLLQPPDPLFKGALVAALLRSCVLLLGLSVNGR